MVLASVTRGRCDGKHNFHRRRHARLGYRRSHTGDGRPEPTEAETAEPWCWPKGQAQLTVVASQNFSSESADFGPIVGDSLLKTPTQPAQLHSSLAVTTPSPQAGIAGEGMVIPVLVAAVPPCVP